MKRLLGILVFGCATLAFCTGEAAPRGGGRPGPAPGPGARGGIAGGAASQRGPVGPASVPNISPGNRFSGNTPAGPSGEGRLGRPGNVSADRDGVGNLEHHLGISPSERSGERTLTAEQIGKREAAVQQWSRQNPQPFTPAWYAQHPNVWQATHPHADLFAAVALADLTRWLAVPVVASYPVASVDVGAVVVTPIESPTDVAPVATEVPRTSNNPDANQTDPASPAQPEGDWLPLGVFDLKPAGATDASCAVQLAVDRNGNIRGTGYDFLSGQTESVTGTIDKRASTAAWTVGKVRFQCPMAELTKPEGNIAATGADGRSRAWELRRQAAEKTATPEPR